MLLVKMMSLCSSLNKENHADNTFFSAHRVEKPCPRGWWGSPMCGPCNCDVSKGFNPDCNKTTGECRCKVRRLNCS